MTVDPQALKAAVAAELAAATDAQFAEHLRKFLVEPYAMDYEWDYGPERHLPCWLVLEHTPSGTGIAFCEYGFGPSHPWGLLWLPDSGGGLSMGQDSGWFPSFMEAALDSFAAEGFQPPPAS